ncbi:MAG: hypothetical protein F7B59_08165 [Desulfurococcales archaeon]|nr:hypothetical protein [Desulfurococcales archaeon]
MKEPKVAGLDIGTSKISLVIYDDGFNVIDEITVPNETDLVGPVAEQNPDVLLAKVKGLMDKAVKEGVKIIGIATYRGSLVIWDKSGGKLSPIITWMDYRSAINYSKLPLKARFAGKLPVIGSAFSPESMAVKLKTYLIENPKLSELLEKKNGFAWNVDGYIAYSLSGKFIADPSTSALTGLINPRTLKPLNIVLKLLELPSIAFPLMPGYDEMNIETMGLEVRSLLGDQQAASIGLQCLEKGCMKIGLGTGFFIDYSLGSEFPGTFLPEGLLPIILYVNTTKRVMGVEGYLTGMGKSVEWFVENLFGGSYNSMDNSINNTSPPIVIPYLWGGRTPRLHKGVSGIIGLEPGYNIESIANGLAHGVSAALSYVYNKITAKYGSPSKIFVMGGLTRLNKLNELVASYLNTKILVSKRRDVTALGAALQAAESRGWHLTPDIEFVEMDPNPDLVTVNPQTIVRWARMIQSKTRIREEV